MSEDWRKYRGIDPALGQDYTVVADEDGEVLWRIDPNFDPYARLRWYRPGPSGLVIDVVATPVDDEPLVLPSGTQQ